MKAYKGIVFLERKEISDLIKSKKISSPLEVKTIEKKDTLLTKGEIHCLNEAVKYAKKNRYRIVSINGISRYFYNKDTITMTTFEFYRVLILGIP